MRKLIPVVAVALVGCGEGPAEPESPPDVWPITVDSIVSGSATIVSAETERDSRQGPMVFLDINCANGSVGGPGGSVRLTDVREPFLHGFVFTEFFPASSATVPWSVSLINGLRAILNDSDALDFVSVLRASDSLEVSYPVAGDLRAYSWDTRAIGVALDSLSAVCNWP